MLTCLCVSEQHAPEAIWLSALASSATMRESLSSMRTCDLNVCDGSSIDMGSQNLPTDWPVESGPRSASEKIPAACSGTLFGGKLETECLLDNAGLLVDLLPAHLEPGPIARHRSENGDTFHASPHDYAISSRRSECSIRNDEQRLQLVRRLNNLLLFSMLQLPRAGRRTLSRLRRHRATPSSNQDLPSQLKLAEIPAQVAPSID